MTLLLTAALLLPINAHTATELSDWEADWTGRMLEGVTVELIDEWQSMFHRHPCELVECPTVAAAIVVHPPVAAVPSEWPGDWHALVSTYFQPEDVDAALRVIDCESGFVLTADNPTSSALGPWQFLRDTWDRMVAPHTGSPSYDAGGPTDPVWATVNASWLWYEVGPSQWSCYR